MAETFKCAFLVLAFVTSFQILFIEGRPIKPANKQQLLTYEKEPIKELASKSMNTNLHHSTADNQKVSLTSPVHSVHHSKADRKDSQPMVPRSSDSPSVRHPETPGANSNNGHSVSAFKEDFEPTTPGHSPGVGHIHADEDQEDNEDVDPKAPSSGSSTGHAGAAFKPTKRGHSPGVGHMSSVDQSDKIDPNSSNIEHSITTPGHSPGFGHILAGQDQDDSEDDAKEPGSESSIGRDGAAFKPTTPGHSPGIGHMSSVDQSDKTNPNPSKIEHSVTTPDEDQDDNEDVDPKTPGSSSSTGRAGAAFKPTKPGHSPGVGHMSSVDQSDKTDPNPSNIEHSVSRVPNDFQPTLPGHSTGVGHVFKAQTKNS
uniref:Precursor of CEP9 n=1 Tax=Salix viminalis TaxID=40686 RepID=A0A6N2M4H3_SALVM